MILIKKNIVSSVLFFLKQENDYIFASEAACCLEIHWFTVKMSMLHLLSEGKIKTKKIEKYSIKDSDAYKILIASDVAETSKSVGAASFQYLMKNKAGVLYKDTFILRVSHGFASKNVLIEKNQLIGNSFFDSLDNVDVILVENFIKCNCKINADGSILANFTHTHSGRLL